MLGASRGFRARGLTILRHNLHQHPHNYIFDCKSNRALSGGGERRHLLNCSSFIFGDRGEDDLYTSRAYFSFARLSKIGTNCGRNIKINAFLSDPANSSSSSSLYHLPVCLFTVRPCVCSMRFLEMMYFD